MSRGRRAFELRRSTRATSSDSVIDNVSQPNVINMNSLTLALDAVGAKVVGYASHPMLGMGTPGAA